jgi:hypothetical protein
VSLRWRTDSTNETHSGESQIQVGCQYLTVIPLVSRHVPFGQRKPMALYEGTGSR